jgi:hypothetical protein
MKDQFQSTEALKVRFPPFVNKSTGDEILGTDTCTVTYKKPDNSTGSLSATWDTDIQLWKLDIASGSYMQGEWLFKAVSSDTNGRTQRKSLQWGDYVGNLDVAVTTRATQAQILSDATPFAGAKLAITGNVASSAEVLAISNNTSTRISLPETLIHPPSGSVTYQVDLYLYDNLGNMEDPDSTPTLTVVNEAGTDRSGNLTDGGVMTHVGTGHYRIGYVVASTHAHEQLRFEFTVVESALTRLAGASTRVSDEPAIQYDSTDRAMLTTLHAIGTNRWKVDAVTNLLTIYEVDGLTPRLVFDLLGSDGNPNPHLVYERVPV